MSKKTATCPKCGYVGVPEPLSKKKCPVCGEYLFGCIKVSEFVYERLLRRKLDKESIGDIIVRLFENVETVNIIENRKFNKCKLINVDIPTSLRVKLNTFKNQNGKAYSHNVIVWSVIESEYNK